MALNLSLTYVQRKDNKAIILSDNTGSYSVDNPGGWGAPNIEVTDIDGSTHTLTMDVVKKGKDNNDTVFDTIDLYQRFGPFTDTTDLVFTLTADMFISDGSTLGTSEDVIPDGVYEFTYIADKGLGTESSLEGTLLIDGVVRTKVYKLLSEIPTKYNCINYKSPKIDYAILANSYLDSMHASAYLARIDDILMSLETLQKIVLNGDNSIN